MFKPLPLAILPAPNPWPDILHRYPVMRGGVQVATIIEDTRIGAQRLMLRYFAEGAYRTRCLSGVDPMQRGPEIDAILNVPPVGLPMPSPAG